MNARDVASRHLSANGETATQSESPPATNGSASKSLDDDTTRIPQGTDNAGLTREFVDVYRLGFHAGYPIGYAHGVDDENSAWTAIVTGWAEVWRRPRYVEVEAHRAPSNAPCREQCGRCSRCVRAAAVERNRVRFGTADFPGVRGEAA